MWTQGGGWGLTPSGTPQDPAPGAWTADVMAMETRLGSFCEVGKWKAASMMPQVQPAGRGPKTPDGVETMRIVLKWIAAIIIVYVVGSAVVDLMHMAAQYCDQNPYSDGC
jgi:hypothetical protein